MASALEPRAGEPRAGLAVAGVLLGGLGIGGAVALVTAPLSPHLAVVRTPVVAASGAPAIRSEATPAYPERGFD